MVHISDWSQVRMSKQEKEILQDIFDVETVEFSVLFGSRAVGEATSESDTDIAIRFSENVDVATELFRIEEEYAQAGFDDMQLDIAVLDVTGDVDGAFLETVFQQAVLLTGTRTKYEQFKNTVADMAEISVRTYD